MGTVTWVVMLALGIGIWILLGQVHGKVEPLLERIGAAAWVGAGTLGASGSVGGWVNTVTDWAIATVNDFGRTLLGGPVVWIVTIIFGIAWVGAFLPKKWAKWDYPDWLIVTGFFLPGLLAATPGPIGDLLRSALGIVSDAAITLVSMALGQSA